MRCEVDRDEFRQALASAVKVIPRRTTYPVLQNLKLEVLQSKLRISGTDLDTFLEVTVPARDAKPGGVLVPGKKILEWVWHLDSPTLTMEHAGNVVSFQTQGRRAAFVGLPPEEFPEEPHDSDVGISIHARLATLQRMYRAVGFCASRDEARAVMCGIRCELTGNDPGSRTDVFYITHMVATDGHRLALIDLTGSLQGPSSSSHFIVLPKLFEVLPNSSGDALVTLGREHISLKWNRGTAVSRLIEGPYLEYERVIPRKHPNQLRVKRKVLIRALRRAAAFANPVAKSVTFDLKNSGCQILSETPELGLAQEPLVASYAGADIKTAFNALFLTDILSRVSTENVAFEFNTALNAVLVRPDLENSELLYLQMPIRMD